MDDQDDVEDDTGDDDGSDEHGELDDDSIDGPENSDIDDGDGVVDGNYIPDLDEIDVLPSPDTFSYTLESQVEAGGAEWVRSAPSELFSPPAFAVSMPTALSSGSLSFDPADLVDPTAALTEVERVLSTPSHFGADETTQATTTSEHHGAARSALKFAGGCDCRYNPNTCGAGWACRWY